MVALLASPAPSRCVVTDITAVGRSAHGATPLRHSATHRLIRALDRLPRWLESTSAARRYRIVNLRAAPAVNIISPRAAARVELEIDEGELALSELRSALGSEVEVRLSTDSCGTAVEAPR